MQITPKRPGLLRGLSGLPYAPEPDLTIYGDDPLDREAIVSRLEAMPGNPVMAARAPQGGQMEPPAGPQGLAAPQLPPAPPTVSKADTNPWSKANRQRTLLDIGSAFMSNDNFFHGLGAAGQAVGGRMDELKAAAQPKREFGGPGGQFEIITNPDGSRVIREVPEFAKALRDEREAKNRPDAPKPKDVVDLRARALYAVSQLPEEERSAAYADIMMNPGRYGGFDTSGMPQTYDPRYAAVMGGMGQTVNQAENSDYRERAFGHRKEVDRARLDQGETRLQQGEKRLSQSPSNRPKSSPKPPSGFILD